MPTPKYIKIPTPLLGHNICSIISSDSVYYTLKLLRLRHATTTLTYAIDKCVPLTENETAQVDMLMNSITYHEDHIAQIRIKIEEREESVRKIGIPPSEPFIG